jgi:pyridoxine/pyridoxamine 5'-phosphate oxidase
MDDKKFVLDYIKQQDLIVIATVSPIGLPQDAVVGFGITDNFEIIFRTFNTSRKYQNIKKNPNVALVIGWVNAQTVQMEGEALELTKEEAQNYKPILFAKNPHAKLSENDPRESYFKVTPKWIRFTDLKFNPWKTIEINF